MNGRVYNPTLARFVSADPLISNPDDTQNYNRYSYVHNRPMFFTDPSGFETDCNEDCQKAEELQEEYEELIEKIDEVAGMTCNCSVSLGGAWQDEMSDLGGEINDYNESINSIANASPSVDVVPTDNLGNTGVTPKEGAGVARAQYGDHPPPGGWISLSASEIKKRFGLSSKQLKTSDGLDAGIYYNEKINTYAVAYAGTEVLSPMDHVANISQGWNGKSSQYTSALEVATLVSSRIGNSNLVFVGHSLGGGQASAASLATGYEAMTYNAAGLHPNTVGGTIDHSQANDQIQAFYAPSDPLSIVQDNTGSIFPSAIGSRVKVTGASGHGIDSMYNAL